MKAVDIDFLPRRPPRRWPWWLASVVLFGIAGYQVVKLAELRREIAALERQAAERAAEEARRPPPPPPPPWAREAAEIARWASLDISGVFAAIESARVPGVRLTSLDIDAPSSTARIELEIHDMGDVVAYVEAINAGMPENNRWRLVTAKAGSAGGPGAATLEFKIPVAARPGGQ